MFLPGLGEVGDRSPISPPPAVMVDRLPMSDREQPASQVRSFGEIWKGTQRRHEGVLKAVVGLVSTHRSNEKTVDVFAVGVQECLKGR